MSKDCSFQNAETPPERPPASVEWLLRLVVPARVQENLIGDLHEEYAQVCERHGRRKARFWALKQAFAWSAHYALHRSGGERQTAMLPDSLGRDIVYACRTLLKSPSFAIITLATLTLGIGFATAVFSIANAVLFRPLPFRDSAKLVTLWSTLPQGYANGISAGVGVAPLDYFDWKAQNHVFSGMALVGVSFPLLRKEGGVEELRAERVSDSFFSVLGIHVSRGREFLPGDFSGSAANVAIVSHDFLSKFNGAAQDGLGWHLTLDNQAYTVIGVMPRDLTLPSLWGRTTRRPDLWIPLRLSAGEMTRTAYGFRPIARLKPQTTLASAQNEMSAIGRRLAAEYPGPNRGMGVGVIGLSGQLFSNTRPLLLTLLGGVTCVLLIGCLNIANLLLVRASSRRQEISVRTALGASRARLVAMLLTESILLGVTGGMGGLAFAYIVVPLLLRLAPESSSLPRLEQVVLDADVFLFTLLLSVVTAIFFGLMPAVGASKLNLHEAFKEGGRTGTTGRGIGRLRGALVVIEVALCLILLVGAGLSIQSFRQLSGADTGYRASGLLTFQVSIPTYKYQPGTPRVRLYRELASHLGAMPGVQSVGLAHVFPDAAASDIEIEGRPVYELSQVPKAAYRVIDTAYFSTLELPLKNGRFFSERDTDHSPPVTVISDSMARRFWPAENPIGKRIRRGRAEGAPWLLIVGVVTDVRRRTAVETVPEFYLPFTQLPPWYAMTFLVRTSVDPLSIAPLVHSDIAQFDPDLPVEHVKTMTAMLEEEIWRPRFSMVLSVIFGSVSLFLAAAGVYGVLSFLVAARTREMGIRIALGATPGDVKKLIVGYGLRLGIAGLAGGTALLFCLARLLQHVLYGFQPATAAARAGARPDVQAGGLLYGVKVTDPAIFGAVVGLLLTVTVLACYIPARRATRYGTLNAMQSD